MSVNMDDAAGDLPSGAPLVRRDGMTVVADAEDLIQDGMPTLVNPVNIDEDGEPAAGYAWTGTTTAGAWSSSDCLAWTNATDQEGADVGALAATDGKWTKAGALMPFDQNFCFKTNHLYCFRTLEP